MANPELNTFNKVETTIKLVGSPATNTEITILLAYIRNLINSNSQGEIKVSVGKNIANDAFFFSVNDQEIPDLVAKGEASVN